jgi:hypothetical protein
MDRQGLAATHRVSTLWLRRTSRRPCVSFPFLGLHGRNSCGWDLRNRYARAVATYGTRLIAPGFGILFAILLLATGWRQKSALMMWFGIYFIALARLLCWMPGTNYELMSTLQVGAGLPLAVFGALRLRSFLKENPMPMEPANG